METVTGWNFIDGSPFRVVKWDFQNLTAEAFKRNFKSQVQRPLQRLLSDFNRDPKSAEFPSALSASIGGLMNELSVYYQNILSRPDEQRDLKALENFSSAAGGTVAWIHHGNLEKIRKTCLSIINPSKPLPFTARPVPFEVMQQMLPGPGFSDQMIVLRSARPGFSFPVAVSWRIEELVPTPFSDTFLNPTLVRLIPEADLHGYISPAFSRKYLFETSLLDDESLSVYVTCETCMICRSTGVMKKLQRCSKCNVARYCGREHQLEHWKVHKKHCRKLRALKDAAEERARGCEKKKVLIISNRI